MKGNINYIFIYLYFFIKILNKYGYYKICLLKKNMNLMWVITEKF